MTVNRSRLPRMLVSLAVLGWGGSLLGQEEGHRIRCGGADYSYVLRRPVRQTARPAILLLHGSGGDGGGMVALWRDLARENDVALIAPELPLKMSFEDLAPDVFRCVVEDAGRQVHIDSHRVYVFGYSMGGYLAYGAATFDSDRFAAVAIFAAAIAPGYEWILGRARRKTPIAIYIGNRDRLIPLEGVRWTRDLLSRDGFPVRYTELEGQDHAYAPVSLRINADAWEFFRGEHLADSPR